MAVIAQTREMWDLTVEDAHTFFVGDGRSLVHNYCITKKVPYGGDDLSQAAQQFRLDAFRESGGNVAVFRFEGELPQDMVDYINSSPNFHRIEGDLIISRNAFEQHSEQVIDDIFKTYSDQVDRSIVSHVYSEYSPCTSPNNCFGMLNTQYRDELFVSYSFEHRVETEIKRKAVQQLLKNGSPGVIK